VQIAVLLYDRVTALDAIGPYEILSRLPGASLVFVGASAGPVRTDTGRLTLVAEASWDEVPAPDLVLVPGSPAAPTAPGELQDWLRSVDESTTWTASVCTGSLALAAAGLLTGRRATSHWLALPRLADFGAVPVSSRVVVDGKYATAAGVSAGLDLALDLAARIAGVEVAQTIQLAIEYDPEPPFSAGSPRTAPPAIVAALRARRHLVLDA
jgi:transcriptional regulator GlxA family with amidase domain